MVEVKSKLSKLSIVVEMRRLMADMSPAAKMQLSAKHHTLIRISNFTLEQTELAARRSTRDNLMNWYKVLVTFINELPAEGPNLATEPILEW
jgi:hypothetical protein